MRKAKINFWLDIAIFIAGSVLMGTGILMHALPHGSGGRAGYLGLTRHEWGDIHWIISLVFGGLIVLHLLLHTQMIRGLCRACIGQGWKPKIFFAGLALILLGFTLPPLLLVEHESKWTGKEEATGRVFQGDRDMHSQPWHGQGRGWRNDGQRKHEGMGPGSRRGEGEGRRRGEGDGEGGRRGEGRRSGLDR